MNFKELLLQFKNETTPVEYYEMNKDGVITCLVQQVVFGKLYLRNNTITIFYGDKCSSKSFSNLLECIDFLQENDISFKELIPTNLNKIFCISG